ncbi:MAG TPA: DNA-processing protein DprA [Noviherbaspirillum sp.]|jgi:DNA processing protein|uniref:DNA-processing protein DprA n=1 Tax=Noviherbaspirillum sp. TaxID=1926288 RepID=UPI002F95FC40
MPIRDSGEEQELGGWIRLQLTPGVGPVSAKRLLAAFGLPHNIFRTGFAALAAVVPEPVAAALSTSAPAAMRASIDATLAWAAKPGNRILTLADADFPPRLLDIPDPPLILYAKGRTDLLLQPAIAVVGSRNASAQGAINAERFSEALSAQGITVVSGMALGIDAAAHRGGLRGAGSTVAVTGTGPDIIYPARNRSLALALEESGCVLSEYPLGTPALAANFPRRNRIISGLSLGVLVIEAADQSGSLITARTAADQGRDVFALPGSIHSPLSKGCHLLIKQGAKLVECAQDVLDEIGLAMRLRPRAAAAPVEVEPGGLLEHIGFDPVAPDSLAVRTGLSIAELQGRLLDLELRGLVELLPGGMLRRVVKA